MSYGIVEVWCDGNPDVIARKDSLDSALELRDDLCKERPRRRGVGPLFLVMDLDDPERGYLDDHHLDEVSA